MNEQRLKAEHLRDYRGILISAVSNQRFKMELKVEDNPVLKRWTTKNEDSIELDFFYNFGVATQFFHDIFACPHQSRNSGDKPIGNLVVLGVYA